MVRKHYLALAIAALSSTASPGLFAQEQLVLEETIVTARKRVESLQDVPVAVTAFGTEALEARDMRTLEDLAGGTTGLVYENYSTSGLSSAPVIRGMSLGFTTAREQNTSVFLDGVYLQRQSMMNPGMIDMERVEVVKGPQSALYGRNAFAGAINYVTKKPTEDLSGKFGVTYGTDDREDYNLAISGPIFSEKLLGRVSYSASEYDGHTENEHPFAGLGPNGDSTDDNLGGWDDEVLTASLQFRASDKLTFELGYFKNESKREPQPFYNLDGARQTDSTNPENTVNCLDTVTTVKTGPIQTEATGNHAYCGELPTTPPYREDLAAEGFVGDILLDPRSFAVVTETELITARIAWDFAEDWSLEYLYGYTDHDAAGNGVQADHKSVVGEGLISGFGVNPDTGSFGPLFTATTVFNSNPEETLEASSHELQISWSGSETWQARGGLYYSDVEDSGWNTFRFIAPCDSADTCKLGVEGAPSVLPDIFPPGSGHGKQSNLKSYEDNVYAIYGEVIWDVNDRLNFGLEGRYTREEKDFAQHTSSFGDELGLENDETFNYFTPRLTAQYHWTDNSQVYGTISNGVKTGGFNTIDPEINPAQAIYDEEENWSFEVGSKNVLMDGILVLNGSLYYIRWTDLQGTEAADDPDPFATDVVGNIGDVDIYGIEVDAVYQISDHWFVDGGYTYNDPEFDEAIYSSAVNDTNSSWGCDDTVCPSDGDVSGNVLSRTSKQQAQLGLNYRTNLSGWRLDARLDANYRSKMYATPLNLAHNGGRTVGNLSVVLSNEHWTVGLWGKNITDEEYVANSFVLPSFNGYLVALGPRASWGLNASYSF